ncbi:hypothetical protein EON65_14665 [archaeon]|nr:MAG: hypothetical protein EON65_14665 [archaeon]
MKNMYYKWKYRRMKRLFALAVMRKAVIKLQGCYRRRQARKLYMLVRSFRRNKAATKMQCFIRQRISIIRSKRRRMLFNTAARGELFSFESEPSLYADDTARPAMCKFFNIIRTLILQSDFVRAYKQADQLLAYYYQHSSESTGGTIGDILLYWSVYMGVYIASTAYWSKFGPTRQLNLFILERAMGLMLHYSNGLKTVYSIDSNPFTNSSIEVSLVYMRRYRIAYSLYDSLNIFYQLAHYNLISRLKLFDALMLKADILMLYTWLGSSYTPLNVPAVGMPSIKAIKIDRQASTKTMLANDGASSPILSPVCNGSYQQQVSPSHHVNCFLIVRKIWQMLLKAKSLLSQGSSDQYELKFRLELYTSLSTPVSLESSMKEFTRSYAIYHIPRPSAPNFRNLNITSPCGLAAMCKIVMIRYGFVVCVYGKLQSEHERTGSQGSLAAGSRPSVRVRRLSMMQNNTQDTPKVLPPISVFNVQAIMSTEERETLEGIAMQALNCSNLIRPYLLFSNEVEYLAETFDLYTSKNKAARRFSSSSFSASQGAYKRPTVDYRKLYAFLNDCIQLNLFTPLPMEESIDKREVESPWQISLPCLDRRRLELLEKNDSRYSSVLIQRVYRGHCGRLRFQKIKANYCVYRRKKWLAWKVVYKWRCLRKKLDYYASMIQSYYKGRLWRKYLELMRKKIVYIQCAVRVYLARQKVRRERERRNGGPTVYDMIPGGKVISIGDRMVCMKIYRCGNNYRMQGMDMVRCVEYTGHVYQNELGSLIEEYNDKPHESPKQQHRGHGRSSSTSSHMYGQNQKLRIWQYEKITAYILYHLALIPRIYAATNQLQASKKDTELVLIVSNSLHGVFTSEPPAPKMASKVSTSSVSRRKVCKSLNNLNLMQVKRLLPPIKPPGQVPEHLTILAEKKRLQEEERKAFYHSAKAEEDKKKVKKKPNNNLSGPSIKLGSMKRPVDGDDSSMKSSSQGSMRKSQSAAGSQDGKDRRKNNV